MTLSIMKLCHYDECHCAECRDLSIGMLNVVRLSVIMLSVVAPFGKSKVLTDENLTRDPKIEGLNPAVGTTREKKMEKSIGSYSWCRVSLAEDLPYLLQEFSGLYYKHVCDHKLNL
jgi:hypothetical protein